MKLLCTLELLRARNFFHVFRQGSISFTVIVEIFVRVKILYSSNSVPQLLYATNFLRYININCRNANWKLV